MSQQSVNPQLFQKTLSIDSSQRYTGIATDFNVRLPIPTRNEFNKISLLMLDAPKGYYMVDTAVAAASSITYTDLGAGSPVIPFPTEERNYTASQFAAVLKTMLELGSAGTGSNDTYTVTFLSYSGKFQIVNDAGNAFTVVFDGALFSKYSGFVEGVSNTSTVDTLVSTIRVNLQRYDVIYVHSSLAANNGDDVLAEIYMNDVSGLDVLSFQTPDANLYSRGLSNRETDNARFSLQDKDGNIIDLNGGEWRCIIALYSYQMKNV
jgi:hypothetical protein